MNKQPALSLVKQWAAFVALVLVLALDLWGIPITTNLTARVGHFFLSTTATGISLYQPGKYAYYEFSPWNDYVLDSQGKRTALIPVETASQFTGSASVSRLTKLARLVSSLAGRYQPAVTFSGVYQLEYQGLASASAAVITRKITQYPQPNSLTALAATMTYSRDDLVFDNQGVLYTENPQRDVEFLSQYYNLPLTRHDITIRQTQAGSTVYVLNPRIPGVLAITASSGANIQLNKDWKFIELVQPLQPGEPLTSTMRFSILENPQDVRLEL